jgi:endo-1,4-beta-D-glucanase Y
MTFRSRMARALTTVMLIACAIPVDRANAEKLENSISGSVPSAAAGAGEETREIIRVVSRAWFKSEWRAYASTFVTPDGRIVDNANENESHSEGQGYGLLLAAFADDPGAFQLIWSWTEKNLQVRPDPLLAWRWDPSKGAVADHNNATDGDILVAWGLAEGARRFARPDYLSAAKKLASAIGSHTLKATHQGLVLLPGSTGFSSEDQPDGPIVNLSYWIFPAFSVLDQLAPGYDWERVRETGLNLLRHSQFGPRSIPADWQSVSGPTTTPARNFPSQFGYDAIRIPLYLAWSGDGGSRAVLRRFTSLWRGTNGRNPSVIDVKTGVAGQVLDGAGYRLVMALAGCASSGQPIDADLIKSRDAFYYPATLRMLSLAAIQERFPQCL